MGGKLTSGGIKLPNTGEVEQTKVVISVDGKEADETGNINLGGAFDFIDKKTQIRGCKALTWNTLRVQGIDDWEKYRDNEFSVDEESLTVSTLTGEYVYIAEVDDQNKSSAYYRSDNAGATYSRHILPTEGVDVKLIRTSETGQVVLLSTHIGGVLISEDYGKTWIIPHSLGSSTSNSDSSWFISMSSNGQNLIYPNTDGDLYLENPSSVDFGLHTLVLPSGVTPNSIKEFFVSNHTDRANIKMVMMTRNGNVYTSLNGGVQWSHAISGVSGMYTDKDVERIYVIKGTTVQYRNTNGTGFSTKVDFKTYSKYQDLTRDPNTFELRSIFVSHDHDIDKSNIAVFTVSGSGGTYGTSNIAVLQDDLGRDVVEGEDVLSVPYAEKPFTGILISEDSGNTWDLSQIKYSWGMGTPTFHYPGGLDQTIGYPRLQLIENFESGLFIYSKHVGISKSHNNIIRICDKSTSYSSTSKMILDGGITLGQSMEADTEYFNKMPGTIEYENFSDGYVFHFDECSWTFYEHRTGNVEYSADSSLLKPLVATHSSGHFGKPVKLIEFSDTLKGMDRLESYDVAITNSRVPRGELLTIGGVGYLSSKQTQPYSRYRISMTRSHSTSYTSIHLREVELINDSNQNVLREGGYLSSVHYSSRGTGWTGTPQDGILTNNHHNAYSSFPGDSNGTHWYEWRLNSAIDLENLRIYGATGMRDWKFQGSNDGSTWEDILDFTDYPIPQNTDQWNEISLTEVTSTHTGGSNRDISSSGIKVSDISGLKGRVETLEQKKSDLILFSTPIVFKNRDGETTLADLPIAKKLDGTDSVWRRLSYSAISSEIPNGAVLYCRGMGASAGYNSNSRLFINHDVSGSAEESEDWWEHAWMISYDAGATKGGGNLTGRSNSVKDGYLIPLQGINSNTNSILIRYYSGFQKLAILGWMKLV